MLIDFKKVLEKYDNWFGVVSFLTELTKREGVHITMVLEEMVGSFNKDNFKNIPSFLNTCIEDFNRNKNPESLLCIIRYNTPFKINNGLYNEKLVAGCILKESFVYGIDEQFLMLSKDSHEKEVKFVSLKTIVKHLRINKSLIKD
jgi:hypothetical protein